MFGRTSIPSLSRVCLISLCAMLLTYQRINARRVIKRNETAAREFLMRKSTKMPASYFFEQLSRREDAPILYDYRGEMETSIATKEEPYTDEVVYDYEPSYGTEGSSGTREDQDQDISLYVENPPCTGDKPCSTSTQDDTEVLPNDQDYQAQADFGDRQNKSSSPLEKSPCSGGSPCPSSTITREQMEQFVYDRVRNNILKQLNMKEPPNVTIRDVDLNSPPVQRILRRHGIKSHRRLDDELVREDDEGVTTKQTVISYSKPPLTQELSGMHFTFSEDDLTYSVTSAEIWLHVKGHREGSRNVTLEFYRYQESRNGTLAKVKFNRKKIKVHRHGEWRRYVMTSEVSRWFVNPSSNYGIDVVCPEIPDLISGVDAVHKKPIMEVQIEHSTVSRRKKRGASLDCDVNSKERSCCRHNLTVSFEVLGWHWVIGPKYFESYHCFGDCVYLNFHGNYQRMHYMAGSSQTRSCCSPTKMSPIKLLYFDHDENIVYSHVEDMVIQKCGCV